MSIRVLVNFTSTSWETGEWVDITSDVMEADWSRGRRKWTERFEPNVATIKLHSPDRKYDPFNTEGPYYPLEPNARMRIQVKPDEGTTPWQNRFTGRVRRWSAEFHEDKVSYVTLSCVDELGVLDRGLSLEGTNTLARKATNNSVWHVFDEPRRDGYLSDFSASDRLGVTRPNDVTDSAVAGNIIFGDYGNFTGDTSLDLALPADVVQASPGGFLMVIECVLDPTTTGVTGRIFRAGGDQQTGDVLVRLSYNATQLSVAITGRTFGPNNPARPVGPASDWINKRILIMAGSDPQRMWTLFARMDGSIPPVYNTMGAGFLRLSNIPADGCLPPKFGRVADRFEPDPSGGLYANVFQLLVSWEATSREWAYDLAERVIPNGFAPRTPNSRFSWLIKAVGAPAWLATADLPDTDDVFITPKVRDNALEEMQDLIASVHGAVFVNLDTKIEAMSHESIRANATGSPVSEWTDELIPDAIEYRDGSVSLDTTVDDIANSVNVTTALEGETNYTDAASVAKYGVQSRHIDAKLTDLGRARRLAISVVVGERTPRVYAPEVTFVIDRDPPKYWGEIMARELYDCVLVRRQPMGVGSVANIKSIIEGEQWTHSAETGTTVTFFLSPAEVWYGVFP